jgi:hypothetical protein
MSPERFRSVWFEVFIALLPVLVNFDVDPRIRHR